MRGVAKEIAGRVWQPACMEAYPCTQAVAGSIPAAPTGAVRLFGRDEWRRLAGARQIAPHSRAYAPARSGEGLFSSYLSTPPPLYSSGTIAVEPPPASRTR